MVVKIFQMEKQKKGWQHVCNKQNEKNNFFCQKLRIGSNK
jgi:hypothetical protein